MGLLKSKWITKDPNSLEDGLDGALQVKVAPTGGIERSADGIKAKLNGTSLEQSADGLRVDPDFVQDYFTLGLEQEFFTLTATDILNKYILISKPPSNRTEVVLNVVTSCNQIFDVDYTVDATNTQMIRWDGLQLENELAVGDILHVIYSTSGTVVIEQEFFTLTSTDITNKYITLSYTPIVRTEVLLSMINGHNQVYDIDYVIDNENYQILRWEAYDLDGVLAAGDKMHVIYARR